jgi:hypothetical protein
MADKYEIPLPKPPEKTQLAQHRYDQRRANIAVAIAVLAATFTGWQAWEAHNVRKNGEAAARFQAEEAKKSADAAQVSLKLAEKQALAAEKNALIAERNATLNERGAKAIEQTARASQQALNARRPILTLALGIDKAARSFSLDVRNQGESTALGVAALSELFLSNDDESALDEKFATLDGTPTGSTSPLRQGESMTFTIESIDAFMAQKPKRANRTLYLIGKLSYTDLTDAQHQRDFCYYFANNDPTGTAILCDSHNVESY